MALVNGLTRIQRLGFRLAKEANKLGSTHYGPIASDVLYAFIGLFTTMRYDCTYGARVVFIYQRLQEWYREISITISDNYIN